MKRLVMLVAVALAAQLCGPWAAQAQVVERTIAVSSNPTGATMTFDPADNDLVDAADAPCTVTYDDATEVTITAPDEWGSLPFLEWRNTSTSASLGADPMFTVTLTATLAITAVYGEPPADTYVVDASADENGSLDPEGLVEVADGEDQLFTATPDEGYTVDTWTLDDEVVQTGGTTYTLEEVTEDHVLLVTFKEKPALEPQKVSLTLSESAAVTPTKVRVKEDGEVYEWETDVISGKFTISGSISLEWMEPTTTVSEGTEFGFAWGDYTFDTTTLGTFVDGLGDSGTGSCKFTNGKGKATVYENVDTSLTEKPKLVRLQTITVSSNKKTMTWKISGVYVQRKDMDEVVGYTVFGEQAADLADVDTNLIEEETTATLTFGELELEIPITLKGKYTEKEVALKIDGEKEYYTKTAASLKASYKKK